MRTFCKYEVAIVVFVVVEIVAAATAVVKAIMATVIVTLAIVIIGVMVTIQGAAYIIEILGEDWMGTFQLSFPMVSIQS